MTDAQMLAIIKRATMALMAVDRIGQADALNQVHVAVYNVQQERDAWRARAERAEAMIEATCGGGDRD